MTTLSGYSAQTHTEIKEQEPCPYLGGGGGGARRLGAGEGLDRSGGPAAEERGLGRAEAAGVGAPRLGTGGAADLDEEVVLLQSAMHV